MDRRALGAAPASPRSPRSPRAVSWDAALPPPAASAFSGEPADGWPALAPGLATIAEDAPARPRRPPRPPSNDALRACWSETDLAARGAGEDDSADTFLAAARPAPRASSLPEALGRGLRALGRALADAALGAEEEPPPGGDFLPSLNSLALSPLAVGAWD